MRASSSRNRSSGFAVFMSHNVVAVHISSGARPGSGLGRLTNVVALMAGYFTAALLVTSPATAATGIAPQLLGEWEVTRAIMPQSLSRQQWSMRENDPRLMSRTLVVTSDSVNFQRYEPNCALAQMAGAKNVSMRALFAKEGGLKRPAAMKGLLYGRAIDYELASLKGHTVDLWQVTCKSTDGRKPPFANWIAVSSAASGKATTLLVPNDYDALLLMRSMPSTDVPLAAQAEFCKQTLSASDKAVCANRQLLRLHSFVQTARARVVSDRQEFNDSIEATNNEQLKQREACNGDTICLYEALDRQLFLLGMNMTR